MGVLESIKVKQENYPYRYKYEEFYRTFELLSPEYVAGRYDLMSEATLRSKDPYWRDYTIDILKQAFGPCDEAEYADFFKCGRTKILMDPECKLVLDESRAIAVSLIIIIF